MRRIAQNEDGKRPTPPCGHLCPEGIGLNKFVGKIGIPGHFLCDLIFFPFLLCVKFSFLFITTKTLRLEEIIFPKFHCKNKKPEKEVNFNFRF